MSSKKDNALYRVRFRRWTDRLRAAVDVWQEGLCALCRHRAFPDLLRDSAPDGRPRGLLCRGCMTTVSVYVRRRRGAGFRSPELDEYLARRLPLNELKELA